MIPYSAVGNKYPLLLMPASVSPELQAALTANLAALPFDFVARQKIGGITLNFFIIKQFPVLPPDAYREADLAYIVPRVLELAYTAHDLKPFAVDLGYQGEPFLWNPDRRHQLKCELDAYYAHLYGLERDELLTSPTRKTLCRRATHPSPSPAQAQGTGRVRSVPHASASDGGV